MTVAFTLALLTTSALLWGGVAFASIPIIIHLLSRRRVRKVRWAAMQWLLNAMKRHQRRLRLENWLILAMRVAALILLGLALARPILTDSPLAGLLENKRSVYLVLDNSYSTDAKMDARSVFEAVKNEAELVFKTMSREDTVCVILTNDPDEEVTAGVLPHVLVPRTVGSEGVDRAKEEVATLQPRHATANWPATLRTVQGQMAPEDVNRLVVVVTDLQAQNWLRAKRETIDDEADAGDEPAGNGAVRNGADGNGSDGSGAADQPAGFDRIRERMMSILRQPSQMQIIDVARGDRRNLGVQAIDNRTPSGAFVGRPLNLVVSVANYGAVEVVGAQLEVYIDGRPTPQRFPVPALPAADIGLRIPKPGVEQVPVDLGRNTFESPGSHEIRCKVVPPRSEPGADALGLDSERWFALDVRPRIEIVAWTRKSRDAKMSELMYLQGLYEGDGSGNGPGLPGPASLYGFRHVSQESDLVRALSNRHRESIDLIVLANVAPRDPNMVRMLREYVSEGGGLLVFTGDNHRAPEAFNDAFHGETPEERLSPYAIRAAEVRDPAKQEQHFEFDYGEQEDPHPLARPFVAGDEWTKTYRPQIWGRTPFVVPAPDPSVTDGDKTDERADGVVLRYTDGEAAIVTSKVGYGRTVWISTSLDYGWMFKALFPFLPIFLEESALYLTKPDDAGQNLGIGDPLRSTLPLGAQEPRLSIPGGTQRAVSTTGDEGPEGGRASIEWPQVGTVGVWKLAYQLQDPTGEVRKIEHHFAVNPDPAEGSLLPASPDALSEGIPSELGLSFPKTYGETGKELVEAREGEVTKYVLWLLIALLVLESFLAMRFGRRSTSTAEAS